MTSSDRDPGLSVHVVMVNYNSSGYVAHCLRSMPENGVGRIVVVDNASAAEDREHLAAVAADNDRVEVLWSAANVGFGAGVNAGVRHLDPADDDVFVVLNPDTRVLEGAFEALAAALRAGTFDVVSPVIYTGEAGAPAVWFGGGEMDLRRGETVHIDLGRTGRAQTGSRAISFVTGAAPAMTGRTWRDVGGFREDLFLYWEDADFSLRAVAQGKRLGLAGDALVWHEEGGSGGGRGRSAAYHYYMQRNRLLVLRPIVGLRPLLVGSGTGPTLRLVARAALEPQARWRKVRLSLLGLCDGIRGRTGARPV
jgi:N-acetylglucosaminyl-diphospho-decaprenol L-rhamnosyltransferase